MNENYRRVLVIGGGIGGLCAATALRQAGSEVDLVEVKPSWDIAGVGLIQPANALRALASLGLAEACMSQGFPYDSYRYCKADGSLMEQTPGPRVEGSPFPPYNGIRRSALHNILLDGAQQAGAQIRMGCHVVGWTQQPDRVEVRFSDGATGDYSLVVASDGIYSSTRRLLFGDTPSTRTQLTGQSVWRVNMPRPADVDYGVMMIGSNRKAGFIPVTQDSMYLLLVTHEEPGATMPRDRLPALLRERLAPFGGVVERTIHHIDDDTAVVYRPLEVVMMPAPWHAGRVLLVGDAAHASTPHLGQGAAMAIEDVVVLAELVGKQLALEHLMATYMQRRFDRATFIQTASLTIGEFELGRRPGMDLFALLAKARRSVVEAI